MVRKSFFTLFFLFSLAVFLPIDEMKADVKIEQEKALEKESSKPFLKLEAGIKGKDSLYPGQRTWLFYRYYFQGNISLTVEQLPLLDAAGLVKIGEKEFKDYVEGTTSVSEILQQVEAVKPGSYSFGPSRIEGNAQVEGSLGNPTLSSEKLASEAPPVVVKVLPFPEKDQPASFNGAVGIFTFKASLKTPQKMMVGDDISLSLEIFGKGNLKNITAPDLCCQPGFSGFFSFSDLPPSEEIEGEVKRIVVKLRPLNVLIKAIPEIEFSYFNPETSLYVSLHSPSISISVEAPLFENAELKDVDPLQKEKKISFQTSEQKKPISIVPGFQDFASLNAEDLHNKLFGSWWTLALLPIGLFLLFYQKLFKDELIWKRMHTPSATGRQLLVQAFSQSKKGECDFNLLKMALKLGLVEAGILVSAEIPEEQLPNEGLSREVKEFLAFLDEKRFSGKETYNVNEIRQLAEVLMNKILRSQ